MLWDAIKSNVLLPASTRMGTATAGALVAYGVESGHAATLGTALPVLVLVAVDFVLAWFRKRAIQNKAIKGAQ